MTGWSAWSPTSRAGRADPGPLRGPQGRPDRPWSGSACEGFFVDAWDPATGRPSTRHDGGPGRASSAQVDADVELPATRGGRWTRRRPAPPAVVLLVDGVRRIDARIWVDERRHVAPRARRLLRGRGGPLRPGAGAPPSWSPPGSPGACSPPARAAADVVAGRCATAVTGSAAASRKLPARPSRGTCGRWRSAVSGDGPRAGTTATTCWWSTGRCTTGRTCRAPSATSRPTGRVPAAELPPWSPRCGRASARPVFLLGTPGTGYTWYLRLPGPGRARRGPGIVRVECSADLTPRRGGRGWPTCQRSTLPRFASTAYKDPRAPQNLVPIAGLERRLRGMLGDARLLHRALHRGRRPAASPAARWHGRRVTRALGCRRCRSATTWPARCARWRCRGHDPSCRSGRRGLVGHPYPGRRRHAAPAPRRRRAWPRPAYGPAPVAAGAGPTRSPGCATTLDRLRRAGARPSAGPPASPGARRAAADRHRPDLPPPGAGGPRAEGHRHGGVPRVRPASCASFGEPAPGPRADGCCCRRRRRRSPQPPTGTSTRSAWSRSGPTRCAGSPPARPAGGDARTPRRPPRGWSRSRASARGPRPRWSGSAYGDPDAVSVGDYHLKNIVGVRAGRRGARQRRPDAGAARPVRAGNAGGSVPCDGGRARRTEVRPADTGPVLRPLLTRPPDRHLIRPLLHLGHARRLRSSDPATLLRNCGRDRSSPRSRP